jgi:hypothetical protein
VRHTNLAALTKHQVLQNLESQQRQYELIQITTALGDAAEQVIGIATSCGSVVSSRRMRNVWVRMMRPVALQQVVSGRRSLTMGNRFQASLFACALPVTKGVRALPQSTAAISASIRTTAHSILMRATRIQSELAANLGAVAYLSSTMPTAASSVNEFGHGV